MQVHIDETKGTLIVMQLLIIKQIPPILII